MASSDNTDGRLGIVGGGQLGKMLSIAASNLGIETTFIDPSKEAVSQHVAKHLCSSFDDQNSVQKLFDSCKAVTFEFENVSQEAISRCSGLEKLAPNLNALKIANDRIREKEFFKKCGLEIAPFVGIEDAHLLSSEEFLNKICETGDKIGFPLILKTCSLGYDGKGQVSLTDSSSVEGALSLKGSGRLIIEKRINFEREISVIAARGKDGEIVCYSSPHNVHKEGILFSSYVTESSPNLILEKHICNILNELNYVGVLAIEFFEASGKYLANEMAPRVHNSGHWTIEGAVTSQFENHVRAVMGLPLGQATLRFPTAMINIVGNVPDTNKILSVPGVHLHLYGKQARPGRKLGHITIEGKDELQLRERFDKVATIVSST